MDDKRLYQQIQYGDKRAMEVLFQKYYKMVCSYIVQFTGDLSEAEDIVQTVFVKLWTDRQTLRITSSLKAYIHKAAYHTFVDNARKRVRETESLEKLRRKALEAYWEDEEEHRQQLREKIREIVAGLPPKCRQIVLLSKEEGLKNREIAERLKISIKTVEAQLRIAFRKIREGVNPGK